MSVSLQVRRQVQARAPNKASCRLKTFTKQDMGVQRELLVMARCKKISVKQHGTHRSNNLNHCLLISSLHSSAVISTSYKPTRLNTRFEEGQGKLSWEVENPKYLKNVLWEDCLV